MESIRKDINYKLLSKELQFLVDTILKDSSFKRDMQYDTEEGDQIDSILPYPIFKISEIPLEEQSDEWSSEEKNKLRLPTFVGKLKEIIYKIRPQLVLEDLDGKTIKIIIDIDEDFQEIKQRLLDLRYEVGHYVFVYDAFRLPMKDGNYCIIIDTFRKMSNERWICRWKPRRGISAKYVPKIIFTLILIWLANYFGLK